jgi:DNA polymerase III delta prime subunit
MIPLILKSNKKIDITAYIESEQRKSAEVDLDIIEVISGKKALSIDEVRQLRKELHIKHPNKRYILFWDFDTATSEAQNALLKVLEDKNEHHLFILHVTRTEPLLSTILSRSRVIELGDKASLAANTEIDQLIQQVISDRSLSSLAESRLQPKNREEAQALLGEILIVLRTHLKKNESSSLDLIKKTLDLLYKLEVYNLNPQLTIDHWILYAKRS